MKPSHRYLRQSLLTGNKTEITPKAYSATIFIKDIVLKEFYVLIWSLTVASVKTEIVFK